ncbi:MAG: MarR family transcriptional regulator [Pseudomonadota bacterium]
MEKAARPKKDRTPQSILHLVKQVQYKAYVRLESVFQPLGITAVQFRILITLSSKPGTSSAELARLYDVKPQTMIKQIAILETKALIDRQVSATNKRLLELRLTPEGEDILRQCQKDSRAMEREILTPLDADEQDALREYLSRLLDALSAHSRGEDLAEIEEFSEEYRRAGVQRV